MKQFQYGLDVNKLGEFISTPKIKKTETCKYNLVIDLPEYRLECATIKKGKTFSFATTGKFETTIYVEEGVVKAGKASLKTRGVMTIPPNSKIELESFADSSSVYFFSGPAEDDGKYYKALTTIDYRDKYWGEIETIVSKKYSGKRMLVKKGKYASLEFHCNKFESYFIHSGSLLLRLRAGRGEDRFFDLPKGSVTVTPPGLMHQRGGLEDTVIIEIATSDEDSDSYLVEDGAKHKMPQLEKRLKKEEGEISAKGKKICFDIDGVLCTAVEKYTDAKPIRKTIEMVNRLYDEGHTIYVFTARFMGRNNNDWKKAYEDGYAFTKGQLDSWGVKYHELFLGKPMFDFFVDDRAVFFNADEKLIEKEIRAKLKD